MLYSKVHSQQAVQYTAGFTVKYTVSRFYSKVHSQQAVQYTVSRFYSTQSVGCTVKYSHRFYSKVQGQQVLQ